MARKISAETRHDLLQAIRERYGAGTKDEKVRILDEFIAVTGYHRKHVIGVPRVSWRERDRQRTCAASN